VQLCLEGYYDGCIFHRIIKDFMAQTGDPTGTGSGGGPGCWLLEGRQERACLATGGGGGAGAAGRALVAIIQAVLSTAKQASGV